MPNYDYECANCRRRFESIHGVHAPSPTSCPLCGGGPVRKAISAPAVHFKGSGWAKKERRAAPTSTKDTADSTSGSDETAPTKATTATAPGGKSEKAASSAETAAADKGRD